MAPNSPPRNRHQQMAKARRKNRSKKMAKEQEIARTIVNDSTLNPRAAPFLPCRAVRDQAPTACLALPQGMQSAQESHSPCARPLECRFLFSSAKLADHPLYRERMTTLMVVKM